MRFSGYIVLHCVTLIFNKTLTIKGLLKESANRRVLPKIRGIDS